MTTSRKRRVNPWARPMGSEMSILKWTVAMAQNTRDMDQEDGDPQELNFDENN